jgi:DNA mismatch endonuclease (patch repair protein)
MIHSEASSLREQYIEYGFLADLCREMWRRGTAVDVLHCHTDRSGYDVVLEAGGIQRHVQLKSSFEGAKTARQKINVRLADKPSGCIVWIRFDAETLEQTSYLWFGGLPGAALPDIGGRIGKHSKGDSDGMKAERPDIRVVNRGEFARVGTIRSLPKSRASCGRISCPCRRPLRRNRSRSLADVHDPETRRRNMAAIRGADTKPELIIRRGLHAKGFRFRFHDRKLPGRPDLVFPARRAVIFVHGCFWHGHDCPLFVMPKTRTEFWQGKIAGNRERDEAALAALRDTGWRTGIVWECALKGRQRLRPDAVIDMLAAWLSSGDEDIVVRGKTAD